MIKSELVERHTNDIFFFLTGHFESAHHLMYNEVKLVCLCICRELSCFPGNSSKICHVKLKIRMSHHINNTFRLFHFLLFRFLSF